MWAEPGEHAGPKTHKWDIDRLERGEKKVIFNHEVPHLLYGGSNTLCVLHTHSTLSRSVCDFYFHVPMTTQEAELTLPQDVWKKRRVRSIKESICKLLQRCRRAHKEKLMVSISSCVDWSLCAAPGPRSNPLRTWELQQSASSAHVHSHLQHPATEHPNQLISEAAHSRKKSRHRELDGSTRTSGRWVKCLTPRIRPKHKDKL